MTVFKFLLGALLVAIFGAYVCNPPAYADTGDLDTVGVQATLVCVALDRSPTVATLEREVSRLEAAYTEESENKVMYAAMHYVCPEYMPIALAAFRDRIGGRGNQIQPGVVA